MPKTLKVFEYKDPITEYAITFTFDLNDPRLKEKVDFAVRMVGQANKEIAEFQAEILSKK